MMMHIYHIIVAAALLTTGVEAARLLRNERRKLSGLGTLSELSYYLILTWGQHSDICLRARMTDSEHLSPP